MDTFDIQSPPRIHKQQSDDEEADTKQKSELMAKKFKQPPSPPPRRLANTIAITRNVSTKSCANNNNLDPGLLRAHTKSLSPAIVAVSTNYDSDDAISDVSDREEDDPVGNNTEHEKQQTQHSTSGTEQDKPTTLTSNQPTVNQLSTAPAPVTTTTTKLRMLVSPNRKQSANIASLVIISVVGVAFIVFGAIIIHWNVSHFEKYEDLCSNPDSETKFTHPELLVWNDCSFKTYPFLGNSMDMDGERESSNKISCNCRQAKIDLSIFAYFEQDNVTKTIESLLTNWDMLEILFIFDNSPRFSVNLNSSDFYSAQYLRVFHFQAITIESFHNYSIINWQNLEYFYITKAHFQYWPYNFEKYLNKISYIHLWDIMYLNRLPNNICQMSNLRAISINENLLKTGSGITTIPDCVVNLQILQSIIFVSSGLNKLPIKLFSHPNMKEFVFKLTNISTLSFVTSTDGAGYKSADEYNFTIDYSNAVNYTNYSGYRQLVQDTGYWNWTFDVNPQSDTKYYFQSSIVCQQWDTWNEWEYFDKYMNPYLFNWLTDTDACEFVCDSDAYRLNCFEHIWQNGVCDSQCNVKDCGFDGGDCNQLCNNNITQFYPNCSMYDMFDNGICDLGCNSSYCSFDFGDCITVDVGNGTYCNNDIDYNLTSQYSWITEMIDNTTSTNVSIKVWDSIKAENYVSSLCVTSWVNDGWCDQNCRNIDSCNYDSTDCSCDVDETWCDDVYNYFSVAANAEIADDLVNYDELCSIWDVLIGLGYDELLPWSNLTCNQTFHDTDRNKDDFIDINELIYSAREFFSISDEKADQINCSVCLVSSFGW